MEDTESESLSCNDDDADALAAVGEDGIMDMTALLWSFVDVVVSLPYDAITFTAQYIAIDAAVRQGAAFAVAEEAFVPFAIAVGTHPGGLPPGVAFRDGRYLFADVNSLFVGGERIVRAALEHPDAYSLHPLAVERLQSFCTCMTRMDNTVDINELARDMDVQGWL